MEPIKRIAVTGGAGQIAYSLLFRLASGEIWGPQQPVALHLLEVEDAQEALKGVVMELEDCSFPLLQDIRIGCNPYDIFEGVDLALLVGAKPRGPNMERKDLLSENGKIFIEQGKALNKASKHAKILVVGNPCNTNCLIAMHHAHGLSKKQFFAMTALDENRARWQLAKKAAVEVKNVTHMSIWGNHSSTLVPDFFHAHICNQHVQEVIADHRWLEEDFIGIVQKRGAEVIKSRGKSSAASAANAIIDSIKSLSFPTPKGQWYSIACCSDDNPYGVESGLIYSFPCKTLDNGEVQVIKGLDIPPFLRSKLDITQKELLEEKACIEHLMHE